MSTTTGYRRSFFCTFAWAVLASAVAQGAETGASHSSDGPKVPSAGHIRPRTGDTSPPVTSFEKVGELDGEDDLAKRLTESLESAGVLDDDDETGERSPSEASMLAKDQKRPGLSEPTPVPAE